MNTFHLDKIKFGNVSLQVMCIETSLQFYYEILGFKILEKSEDYALLSANGRYPEQISLTINKNAIQKPYNTTGLYHMAIKLPNRLELGKVLKRLIDERYPLSGLSDHCVSEAIYICDPDEIGIELYVDKPLPFKDICHWPLKTTPLDAKSLLSELMGNKEPYNEIHPDAEIGHLHFQVSSLNNSVYFYNSLLGFKISQNNYPGAVFLAAGDYHHHLAFNTWGRINSVSPPSNAVGILSYEIYVESHEVLNLILEGLNHCDYSYSIYYKDGNKAAKILDPNGIELNLISNNAPT